MQTDNYIQTITGHTNAWDWGPRHILSRGVSMSVVAAKTLSGTAGNFNYETHFAVYCYTYKSVLCTKVQSVTTSAVTYNMEPYADIQATFTGTAPHSTGDRACIVKTAVGFSSARAMCVSNLQGDWANHAEDNAAWKYGVVGATDLKACSSAATCNVKNSANTAVTTDQCTTGPNAAQTSVKLTLAAIKTR